ncbi:hypothetical protein GG681_10945 [Epibacterium sp. SM1969]|uniref:Uncharacterized protein n=1 Tax=Tritonibacter aquimaris TaxID=2663379 RepID=A0A844ATN8_9RHOB|nr:hypothetical protein [Tritonibacter aquimaris]MQY43157.1 hypothetical protein [Tritonibacter aquimaris]
MRIDWSQSSIAERKALAKVTKDVAATTPLSLKKFLNKALGISGDAEWGDLANFRNGKMSRGKSKMLYAYLAKHHYDQAQKLNADLFPWREIHDVEAFIDSHAQKGKLRVVVEDTSLSLVKRKSQRRHIDCYVRPGQGFCFELDTAKSGFVAAFQGYKGTYYPFPLDENGEELVVRVSEGSHKFPVFADCEDDFLTEDEDLGMHHFVFLTSSNRNRLITPEGLPHRLDILDIHAVRIFVGSDQET